MVTLMPALCSFQHPFSPFLPMCVCVVTWIPDCCRDSLSFVPCFQCEETAKLTCVYPSRERKTSIETDGVADFHDLDAC